ncbi:FtsK/SpoIIIE domain-containing protein [Microbacterium neungamense]|uniref:FtsK/SpoIIIE domain-containing protein n=1 Tax=Microbacterium neungamense TaxID=2810535 RepID=UPI00217CEFB5|nr:FtsK/SpoIIIE domain-containing protein [Microbacterium neungamense]UWF78288.1 cell division protein FtsK [Microbacterium neungamense]
MDATTIVLPSAPADPGRPPLPVLAAVVPVVAGVVLWLVTGSLIALCFAGLGPLMLGASFADGHRARRRARRRAASEADEAWMRADAELERLHAAEHADLWHRRPDAAACLRQPPLRGSEGIARGTAVVIGRGELPSGVRVSGGDDDRSRAFRERAARIRDAPVTVPLGGGICIRAPEPVAAAVVRALLMQLCLRFTPAQLAVHGDRLEEWGLGALPHAAGRRGAFRLGVGTQDGADAAVWVCPPDADPPDGITTVLDATELLRAWLRTPDGVREVAVEGVSREQALLAIAECAAPRFAARGEEEQGLPARVGFAELGAHAAARGKGAAASLAVAIGRGVRDEAVVDLVEDGPHAVVTGMTGTGKSELLTTWVAALAAAHGPDEIAFVLIDFKGGTAFEPLRALPHVTAVVTDLDAGGAQRGVRSLTAELRRREAVLAQAGARDIRDCPGLGRLVIVVDEFAALLSEHADLGAVFTDIAARGRALGMHLVLGTQRAAGVIRDALAANCPLRISLRVADPADSRLVIGSAAAAEIPGGPESRGLAFVRRPRDAEAEAVRVALTVADDLRVAARRWEGVPVPPSPWLPPLPDRVPLADAADAGGTPVLGLADDPELQRQTWVPAGAGWAIVGGPGSGKTAAIRLLAVQHPDAVLVPADPEGAWDAVAELSTGRHGLVLCDDLDVLLAGYPSEYAQLFLSRWETIARSEGGAVVTLSRASGPLTRVIDLLPHRALLRLPSRVEHLAAGGEPGAFDRDRPAGRALIGAHEVQLCWVDEPDPRTAAPGGRHAPAIAARNPVAPLTPRWQPRAAVSGVLTPAVAPALAALRVAHPGHLVTGLDDAAPESRHGAAANPEHGVATSGAAPADRPRILVADPEQWRTHWAQLQLVRATGEFAVAAECAPELRQLGIRDLPPFARLHAGRAWRVRQGRPPERVLLS